MTKTNTYFKYSKLLYLILTFVFLSVFIINTKAQVKKTYWGNGNLKWEGFYVGNALNGAVKSYYESGSLKEIYQYRYGTVEGLANGYYESGSLEWSINFVNNLREGESKTFYETGELHKYYIYQKDNIEGLAKGYYKSGVLEWTSNFSSNKKNGETKEYYENGKIQIVYYYLNDRVEGLVKGYYKSGALEWVVTFEADIREGEAKGYYETGELYQIYTYKNDKIEGVSKTFLKNGIVSNIARYENNNLNGQSKDFYETGELFQLSNYRNDLLDGNKTVFYKNGKTYMSMFFLQNLLNGESTVYYPNGKIQKTYNWENGKLIDVKSCLDSNGFKLNPGTLLYGEGLVNQYDTEGKLIYEQFFQNGETLDSISLIINWLDWNELNTDALKIYNNKNVTTNQIDFAIKWILQSLSIKTKAENLKTYTLLLYKKKNYTLALQIADKALEFYQKENLNDSIIYEIIENIKSKSFSSNSNSLSSNSNKNKSNITPKNSTKTEDIEFVIPTQDIGKYYALIIGVSNYEDKAISTLEKPIADATALQSVLVKYYSFENEKVKVLKNPTRKDIFKEFTALQALGKEDNLLVFYAGHGYYNPKEQQGYWLPSDAEKSDPANWISNSDIKDRLRGIDCKHTLLISDACFSGGLFKTRKAFEDANHAINEVYKLPSRKAMTSGTLTEVPDKSIFIEYLLKRLQTNTDKYLSSQKLFSSMQEAIINNSSVIPQWGTITETGDEGGDFIFVKK